MFNALRSKIECKILEGFAGIYLKISTLVVIVKLFLLCLPYLSIMHSEAKAITHVLNIPMFLIFHNSGLKFCIPLPKVQ